MGLALLKCLMISLVFLFQFHGFWGCIDEERMGLLEFKNSINWMDTAEDHRLPSWVHDRGSDCCAWERVKCNPSTGRVVQLSLNTLSEPCYGQCIWYLNVTSFLPFEELQHLNLSYNSFYSWPKSEGFDVISSFKRLARWKKLEVLDLSDNWFNNDILPFLGSLVSLKTLSLRQNSLEGSRHLQELATLNNLQSLDLGGNSLSGSISIEGIESNLSFKGWKKLEVLDLSNNDFDNDILPFLASLRSLKTLSLRENRLHGSLPLQGWKKLEVLDLSYNEFNNNILPFLASLISLKTLSLSGNRLNGSLPLQEFSNFSKLEIIYLSYNLLNGSLNPGLCELKNLQELDLSHNDFEGILPQCLNNLTSLWFLDLSYNKFKGNISSSLISDFTSLKHISLGYNHFEGTFLFSSFANNSKLEFIDLQSVGNKIEVETDYPPWIPSFQLKVLLLRKCNLNKLTNTVPTFLSTQYDLTEVDLSYNNLKGSFPSWLLENNRRLEVLNTGNNFFDGPFSSTIQYQHGHLLYIDCSNNRITEQLQKNFGEMLPNLKVLILAGNAFEGGIPSSFCNMRQLWVLDLSYNNFSGEIPENLARGCIQLGYLRLSHNRLHGQIFPTYFNMTSLMSLYLDNNQFTRNIVNGLSKCSELDTLDISNNQISGRIPSWVHNLTNLRVLSMHDNYLQGHILVELCGLEKINFLDLSQNNLSGSIPSCLNQSELEHVYLQRNGFTGPLSHALHNISSLLVLDIKYNKFIGTIPNLINVLTFLRVLLLKGNHLSGPIPNHLCQLKDLRLMDLSDNTFSGSIPRCFNNITFGRDMEMTFTPREENWVLGSPSRYYSNVGAQDEVEFSTKNRSNIYKGNILNFMSGLDLSFNNLTGDIPHEIGDLIGLRALNLSYNHLIGLIPNTLSNLSQIESLDLSHNKLSGEIPIEFIGLYSLVVFTVAYNNLSGKTPYMKAQFATFDNTSYEGNPYLCGPPLQKSCNTSTDPTPVITIFLDKVGENKCGIYLVAFFTSFAVSYISFLSGFAAALFINPYWRRMWFHLINGCMNLCYCFFFNTIYNCLPALFQNMIEI